MRIPIVITAVLAVLHFEHVCARVVPAVGLEARATTATPKTCPYPDATSGAQALSASSLTPSCTSILKRLVATSTATVTAPASTKTVYTTTYSYSGVSATKTVTSTQTVTSTKTFSKTSTLKTTTTKARTFTATTTDDVYSTETVTAQETDPTTTTGYNTVTQTTTVTDPGPAKRTYDTPFRHIRSSDSLQRRTNFGLPGGWAYCPDSLVRDSCEIALNGQPGVTATTVTRTVPAPTATSTVIVTNTRITTTTTQTTVPKTQTAVATQVNPVTKTQTVVTTLPTTTTTATTVVHSVTTTATETYYLVVYTTQDVTVYETQTLPPTSTLSTDSTSATTSTTVSTTTTTIAPPASTVTCGYELSNVNFNIRYEGSGDYDSTWGITENDQGTILRSTPSQSSAQSFFIDDNCHLTVNDGSGALAILDGQSTDDDETRGILFVPPEYLSGSEPLYCGNYGYVECYGGDFVPSVVFDGDGRPPHVGLSRLSDADDTGHYPNEVILRVVNL